MADTIRVPKKGEADISEGETVSVRGGKRRKVKKESLVSLVRGAIRAQTPGIKDRRQRIEDVIETGIDEGNKANKRKK